MSSSYQAVTALGLRFTLAQITAAAKQLKPIPTRKVKKTDLIQATAGTKNNFEVVRINGQVVCNGIVFEEELAAIAYSLFPPLRDQESRVFEINHEDGIATACLCLTERAIASLFELPAIAMASGEDGEEIVVVTTKEKFILINDTDDPYASYDRQIPLADAIAEAPALNELAANLHKRGFPKVQSLIISLRRYVV